MRQCENVNEDDGLYGNVLAALDYTGPYWAVLGCNGLYWAVMGCTGLYWSR